MNHQGRIFGPHGYHPKKSVSRAGTPNNFLQESMDTIIDHQGPERNVKFFPFRLSATLAALKIVGGSMLVGLGVAALIQGATYANKVASIYGGIIVILSGVFGAFSVRTNAFKVYVFCFLVSSIVSLVSSVLVIIYAASGLAVDSSLPHSPAVKIDYGDSVQTSSIRDNNKEAAMLINTLIIIVGFLDIVFSLPSSIICLRELCQCYNPDLLLPKAKKVLPRKELLISWLGQHGQQVMGIPSNIPYGKMSPNISSLQSSLPQNHPFPPYGHISNDPFLSVHSSKKSLMTNQRTISRKRRKPCNVHTQNTIIDHPLPPPPPPPMTYSYYPPIEVFSPVLYPPPQHPFPHPMLRHQMIQVQQPRHYPPQWMSGPVGLDPHFQHMEPLQQIYEEAPTLRSHKRVKRHQPKSTLNRSVAGDTKTLKKRKKQNSEEELEKTYTGMDREMAEEFIENTMDPSTTLDHTMSATESEAW